MSVALLVLRLALAAVFAVAALGKLARPGATAESLGEFGVPRRLRRPGAFVLPAVELAVAVLLVLGSTARWGAAAALALLLVFSAAVGRTLRRGERPDCNCFGAVGSSPVGQRTLLRNAALGLAAALVLAAGPGASLAEVDGATVVAVLAGLGGALLLGLTFLGWQLFEQNGRLLARLDRLERAAGFEGTKVGLGMPMPEFALPDTAGEVVTLDDLLAEGRDLLLFFTDPGCHACNPLLPEIGRRRRDPGPGPLPVMLSLGSAEAIRPKIAEHDLGRVLLHEDFELPKSLGITGVPGAILVDRSGVVAGAPAVGANAVGELLAATAPPSLELIRVGAER